MPENTAKVFVMAPKDLQATPTYERMLEVLEEKHSEKEILADRDLFESNAHVRVVLSKPAKSGGREVRM